MFAYCLNNPIYFSDYSGYCAIAWSHGIAGPCPGPYKKGCMDFYAEFIDETIDSMILTNEMKDFLSVIAGEAIGSNTKTQEAVGRNDIPKVSSHCTIDGYFIEITYDDCFNISSIIEQLI